MRMYFVRENILALLQTFSTPLKAAHPEPPVMHMRDFRGALVQLGDALCVLGRACKFISSAHACPGNVTARAKAAIVYAAIDLENVIEDLKIATVHLTNLLSLHEEDDQAEHRLGFLRQFTARVESIKCAASISIKIVEGIATSKEYLQGLVSEASPAATDVSESTATPTASEIHLACLQDEIDALEGGEAANFAKSDWDRIINDAKAIIERRHDDLINAKAELPIEEAERNLKRERDREEGIPCSRGDQKLDPFENCLRGTYHQQRETFSGS
ncbi:hypothetical protein N0V82_002176 [Gnomoniopsis sp. IMI 355080]|nr:hypothetical protein N0V82_002176 [Gnomoniopsis sp. IMI 355080]